MIASQIRANARENLTGKWGKAALITLSYVIIVFVISFLCNLVPVIGQIAWIVISTPISYGLLVSFIKLKRDEEVDCTDFLSNGFSNFGRVWGVVGNIALKMILPICLVFLFAIIMVVSISGSIIGLAYGSMSYSVSTAMASGFGFFVFVGFIGYFASIIYAIVKGYLYTLSFYILNDNDNMSGKEIVAESARLMKGNRWRFFWLGFSFIGWAFLSAFTLGIGMLWLVPYMMVSIVFFYEELAKKGIEPIVEKKIEE